MAQPPLSNGMRSFKGAYILDIVPNPPNLNSDIGPVIGDDGKLSIVIGDNAGGNIFGFAARQIELKETTDGV